MEKFYKVRAVGASHGVVISYTVTKRYASKEMIVPKLLKEKVFDDVWSISAKLDLRLTLLWYVSKLLKIEIKE